jgi:hypothetical protein
MKKTQILITVMVALMFAFVTSNTFAQTKEETSAKLTAHNQAVMKHSKAIASGEAKTKDEQVKHANEATKSLAEAKKSHEELKKAIPEKSKMAAKPHHDNIDKQYAAASTHSNSLNAELKKTKPDNVKVKEHAKNLNDAVDKAEKEHQALNEKTK